MRIKSLPENYTGALTPIKYEIDQIEPPHIVTVQIMGNSDDLIVGEKRLTGESSYIINTANYCGPQINIEPAQWTGFSKAQQRTCLSKIAVDQEISAATYVTGGRKVCGQKTILSDAPMQHLIACGEKDEIAIIAPASQISAKAILTGAENDTQEVDLGNIVCSNGIYVLVIDTAYIDSCLAGGMEQYSEMAVEIREAGNLLAQRNYSLAPASANSIRLCWQNQYGQIDYHTFRQVDETIDIDKSSAYVEDGYTTTGIVGDTTRSIVSECLPKKTIKWLAEIMTAPRVWVEENNGFTKVDVITEKLKTRNEMPEAISIAIRNAKRLTLKQA